MKKSVLLRKVFMVVVMTLALALLLTGAIYTLTSRAIFASIKANEMIPKARALGRLVELRGGSDAASVDTLLSFLRKESSVLGGSFIVVDGEGAAVAASDGVTDEAIASLDGIVRRALAGEEVSSFSGGSFFSSVQLVCVASPMRQNGNVDGAVLMIVPLYEALAAVSGMNSALMLSLLIIMPLIVVLVYYVIGRTLRPLRQMSDAAMGMAAGDFSIEADASQRGEVGRVEHEVGIITLTGSRDHCTESLCAGRDCAGRSTFSSSGSRIGLFANLVIADLSVVIIVLISRSSIFGERGVNLVLAYLLLPVSEPANESELSAIFGSPDAI